MTTKRSWATVDKVAKIQAIANAIDLVCRSDVDANHWTWMPNMVSRRTAAAILLLIPLFGCDDAGSESMPGSNQQQIAEKLKNLAAIEHDNPGTFTSIAGRFDCSDDNVREIVQLLPDIEELYLGETQITDAALQNIGQLQKLKSLGLQSTAITDSGLQQLAGLNHLRTLVLSETPVTDAGVEQLKGLSTLEELYLNGTKITDAGIEPLSQLRELRLLDLQETSISDDAVEHLVKLSHLETLLLRGTAVTASSLPTIQQMKTLKWIDIRECEFGPEDIAKLETALPKCIVQK